MDAHQAEEMANSMMCNSPLPEAGRSKEKLPEEEGSEKLPKEGGGEKHPEEIPTGKLIMPFVEEILPFFPLVWFCNPIFLLDSQNPGNTVGRVEEVPHIGAVSVVQATSSLASSGSALPQEKIKLAHKLLTVSSRITRVLVFIRSSSMY
jgi:hypothetical protein